MKLPFVVHSAHFVIASRRQSSIHVHLNFRFGINGFVVCLKVCSSFWQVFRRVAVWFLRSLNSLETQHVCC